MDQLCVALSVEDLLLGSPVTIVDDPAVPSIQVQLTSPTNLRAELQSNGYAFIALCIMHAVSKLRPD